MDAQTQARLLKEINLLVFPRVARLKSIAEQIDEPERSMFLKEIDWLYYQVDRMSRCLFVTSKDQEAPHETWLLVVTVLRHVINVQANATAKFFE